MQMRGLNRCTLTVDHRPLDDVLQFADVAGKVVGEELIEGFLAQMHVFPSHFYGKCGEEMLSQKRNIVLPCPKRWDFNRKPGQPKIEVTPKPSCVDLSLDVGVRCRQNPHVYLTLLIAAHGGNIT